MKLIETVVVDFIIYENSLVALNLTVLELCNYWVELKVRELKLLNG